MTATSDFDFDLPQSSIGQIPAEPRDSARLLVHHRGAACEHRHVRDLPDILQPGDLLVLNNTKVIAARFHLHKPTGGAVEVLLLEPTGKHREWQALVKPGKRLRVGTRLEFQGEPVLDIVDSLADGRRVVRLLADDLLERCGEIPLPPYITEPLLDMDRYQTVYAAEPGSVAAPTAGLHLTDRVLEAMAERGIQIAWVDLRVGLGTFRPISAEIVQDHLMHTEAFAVSEAAWNQIEAAKIDGRRVIAVGTTTVRTLESVAARIGSEGTSALSGRTDLFIHHGFDWKVVDCLLTNFHVPRSSLLVLVDAFVGPVWRDLYAEAQNEGYRFLSFGDAMLLERNPDKRNAPEQANGAAL